MRFPTFQPDASTPPTYPLPPPITDEKHTKKQQLSPGVAEVKTLALHSAENAVMRSRDLLEQRSAELKASESVMGRAKRMRQWRWLRR